MTFEHGLTFLVPVSGGARDKEGGVQRDHSACDREPTQLEQYARCGSGESGGQLGMKADGQK